MGSKENITAHYKDQMQGLVNEYTLTQELNGLPRGAMRAARGRHRLGYLHPHGASEAPEAGSEH